MIRIHDKSKNGIYNSNMELIDNFTDYSSKNLDFDKPVNIEFLDDEDNAKNPLGTTAHYNPDQMKITIYVTGRHLKDILRSISHELIHHVQNCRGDLGNIGTELGYAQKDNHMRGMEHEAYTMGNIMNFRDFEDNYKKGLAKMNKLQENRLKKLNSMLMKEQQQKVGGDQQQEVIDYGFRLVTALVGYNALSKEEGDTIKAAIGKLNNPLDYGELTGIIKDLEKRVSAAQAEYERSPSGRAAAIERKSVYQTASDIIADLRELVGRRNSVENSANRIKNSEDYAGVSDLPQIAKAFTDKVDALNDAALRKSVEPSVLDTLTTEQIQNQTFKNVQNKMFEIYKAKNQFDKQIENKIEELERRREVLKSGGLYDKLGAALDILEKYRDGVGIFGRVVAKVYRAASGKRRKSPAVAKGKGQGKVIGAPTGPVKGGRVKFDAEIQAVQKALTNIGYGDLLGKSGVDGKYGPMTQSAVDEFVKYNPSYSNDPKTLLRQLVKANVIEADGSLKKQNLQKKSNKAAPPPPPPQAAPQPQQMYDPQQGPTEPVGNPAFEVVTPFGTFGVTIGSDGIGIGF